MSVKRINLKVCRMMHRKPCTHGETEFVKPKLPTVKMSTRRIIPEAATSHYRIVDLDTETLSAMSTR